MPWLYKPSGCKLWWIGYRYKGEQFRKSTGQADETKARESMGAVQAMIDAKKANMLTDSVIDALSEKALPKTTVFAEVQDWLSEAKRTTADGTHARYRPIAEKLLRGLKASEDGPLIAEVTTQQLRAHLDKRFDETSPGTANLERKVLRLFFRRAVLVSHSLKRSPMEGIKHFKANKKKRRRPFTRPEILAVYQKADAFWKYMCLGGYYTGLRLGDLATLRIDEIDLQANMITCEAQKTERHNRVVHVPIFPTFREAIVAQIRERKSGHLWPKQAGLYELKGASHLSAQFYDLLHKALPDIVPARDHRSKGKGRGANRQQSALSFHSLRHTFITELKQSGANQSIAKELAGHSTDSINELYTHIPAASLIEAVGKLPEWTK